MLILGSYPPRECGIATFTHDIVDSLEAFSGLRPAVIAVDEPGGETRRYDADVVARFSQNERSAYFATAQFVNRHADGVLNIQHEYGLFGGEHGEWLIDLLDAVEKPVLLTLHTVLPEPNESMLRVTARLCARVSRVIVLSETARELLETVYGIESDRICVIHHGVPDVAFQTTDVAKSQLGFGRRMVISTFGLINRGKGLEYAIDAMRTVVRRHPEALYLILGQTHPVVRRHEGESYRQSLVARIDEFGLSQHVKLVDKYLDFDELISYLGATDIYLTPYLNPVQVVSGTLAYAVGCGKAVVSTPYLYARELLAHGRGLLADFKDADAIAQRVNSLLDDPALRRSIERRAYRFGRQMTWSNVARQYAALIDEFVTAAPPRELVLPA